ncbi:tRNA glutamyl-Q(34) synthetase GluQRS [Erwinia tracheiphila]|uniref:tRNA glutamyl-Q(34) synthetase GluQRS n=1 Tax=Erwinia tracheiphila TaxID=65700 RepID=UPI00033BB27C|nr:tRNA glutamyl-Q(34) synthetase GluQRS [Erwinia tracheiphila]EOS95880.1 glutamyl-Q tRNA(Asp) ligase [Erwinia tracheiphila PSU-1]UIA88905.1 tRNA glutamyl-Q(34) synthetase GluQRS [Erwinia tracheiphila]UIA97286.1 tRNA glutamyl-Q(34) synthetase GluQRS [Erwinia tracheiphila]
MSSSYIGRFAPSPSGFLHFGSLIAALGSYLQARAQHGQWRVRIDDIDPPREVAGAAQHILRQLEHYGLLWDGEVLWQSQRHQAYREVLAWLEQQQRSYCCTCTRSRIQQCGGIYDGHCRSLQHGPINAAVRLRNDQPTDRFYDGVRGEVVADAGFAGEDFIIHRRDGLFAYNLAVVVDDHYQGVTEVVRGADLIVPTVRQRTLYQQCGWPAPAYLHLPLAINRDGNKLSKQNHTPSLPEGDPRPTLVAALLFLGQPIIIGWQDLPLEMLLHQAIVNWNVATIPGTDCFYPDTCISPVQSSG